MIRHNNKGFTMFEVLTVMAIVGLVGTAIMSLLIGGMNGWSRGASKAYAETSASTAAQKVAQEIRDGQSATLPSGILTVTMPQESSDANGEKCYNRGVAGEVREYYVLNGSLVRRVSGVVSVVLPRVSHAGFSVSGPNVVITITGHEQIGASISSKQAVARVRLRNFKT